MNLEDLRDDDLGSDLLWLPSFGSGEDSVVHMTYVTFVTSAFYNSAEQLEQLEKSYSHINQGNSIHTCIGFWFIAIEAYINTLLRVSCLVSGESFDLLKTKPLGSRVKSLLEILDVDKSQFYSGPFQRLDEFKRYRNELFHDRSNNKKIEFHKTLFSGNPMYVNQVDVMQACVISMEVFEAFRYSIPKLDLMPQIMVKKDDSFFYEKIDVLYHNVLVKLFKGAMSKHSLNSKVDVSVNSSSLGASKIFLETKVKVLIRAIPDPKFKAIPSKAKTRIGEELLDFLREKHDFDTSKVFKVGNYYC